MTIRQINKLNMCLAVLMVLTRFRTIWETVVAFSNDVTALRSNVDTLHAERQKQERTKTGVAKDKKQKKHRVSSLALRIGGILQSYATAIGDFVLYEKVNYSMTDLMNARDTVTADRCRIILTEARAVENLLGDYNLTPAMVTELSGAIDEYVDVLAAPRIAISEGSVSTRNIAGLFRSSDNILKNKLDKMMLSYETTNPDFFQEYQNARIIVDLGKGHTEGEEEVKP